MDTLIGLLCLAVALWLAWQLLPSKYATKRDVQDSEDRTMSAISDFAAKQTEFLGRLETAINGVQDDILFLKTKIEELQNSVGTITPEDQAILDDLQARANIAVDKLEQLDALTQQEGS